MDSARISAIYDELLTINVQLADNPVERGPGYVAATIKKCKDAVERINKFHQEAEKAYVAQRNKVRLFKLQLQELVRAKLLSAEIQDMEESSLQEKQATATVAIENERKQRIRHEYRERGEEPPEEIPTLEHEICEAESLEEELRGLRAVLVEKRQEIKQCDSAVRLQNTNLETEARLFTAPHQVNGVQTPPQTGGRRRRVEIPVATDGAWDNLLPAADGTDNG